MIIECNIFQFINLTLMTGYHRAVFCQLHYLFVSVPFLTKCFIIIGQLTQLDCYALLKLVWCVSYRSHMNRIGVSLVTVYRLSILIHQVHNSVKKSSKFNNILYKVCNFWHTFSIHMIQKFKNDSKWVYNVI